MGWEEKDRETRMRNRETIRLIGTEKERDIQKTRRAEMEEENE